MSDVVPEATTVERGPRKVREGYVVSAGGGRRRPAADPVSTDGTDTDEVAAPIVHEADPELERLLAEEEEIERRTRQHSEAPKFHGDED